MNRRWTIQELNESSDMIFIRSILEERRSGLTNPYSPLSKKLDNVINKINNGKIK